MIIHEELAADVILQRIQQGIRYFANIEVVAGNFKKQNLQHVIFEQSILNTSFDYADLRHASFVECNLKTSGFRYAQLNYAMFQGNAVEAVNMYGAQTVGICFEGNYAYSATLLPEQIAWLQEKFE
ncbi:pentapeptide repeat-containing protein [Paenibacillus sp. WLX2291]|uniref:pentapeptide repeat-containing protein n=1 Tax=Paenibacillus sp. WLX2291 TaxID=3296934 RepID=UPI00398418E3